MIEILFQVEEDPDGGLTAHSIGEAIFTEAETVEQLREGIRDAVVCHFDDPKERPQVVRLHFVRDEVMAL